MKKAPHDPNPRVADDVESLADADTHNAVRAVLSPGRGSNYGAAMHLWQQAADNDFNDNVMHFLGYVARAIVKADANGGAPVKIKNACGLYGRKRSRVEGWATEYLRDTAMFDVIGNDGNPTQGPPPLPSVDDVKRAIESHPDAKTLRNSKKQAAAKKAHSAMRKKP